MFTSDKGSEDGETTDSKKNPQNRAKGGRHSSSKRHHKEEPKTGRQESTRGSRTAARHFRGAKRTQANRSVDSATVKRQLLFATFKRRGNLPRGGGKKILRVRLKSKPACPGAGKKSGRGHWRRSEKSEETMRAPPEKE